MARRSRLATLILLVLTATILTVPPAAAAPTWLAPTNISDFGGAAFAPEVVVDAAGRATAVWSRSDGSNSRVETSTRPPGGVWSAPFTISPAGQDAIRPQIAANPEGTVAIVWHQSDGVTDRIQAQIRLASGLIAMPVTLASAAQDDVGDRQVAVDAEGNATAVWNKLIGGSRLAQASTRSAGSGWSAATILSEAGQSVRDLHVDASPSGVGVTAVWARFDGTHRIQASTRSTNGSWPIAMTISPAGAESRAPEVTVDADGDVTAVWRQLEGAHYRVQARTRRDGLNWLAAAVPLSEAGQSATDPHVAYDAAGNLTAIWSRSDGSNERIQASTRPAAAGWKVIPDTLSVAGSDARTPQLAADANGTTTAVWVRDHGTWDRVEASSRPLDSNWSNATVLSANGRNGQVPQIAVDPAGNSIAVWLRFDGFFDRVQAVGLDAAGPTVASLAVPLTGTAGQTVTMSVSASDSWSEIADIGWTFGDGANGSGSSVSHAYAAAGTYEVTVTLTDAVGNATTRTATITIAAAPAPPAPPTVPPAVVPPIGVAPAITGFRLEPARIRAVGSDSAAKRKTKATVVLTAPAKVTFTVKMKGARKPVAKLVRTLGAGKNTFRLTAKIGKKKLKPGRYVVRASTGQSTKKAKLKVVR
ncbi:PKD domain-containing protein [Nocardioides sp.]|uniref:PKD domain-containing protein n=1 Tax=Nocardioides sp. TaxID=35761 RepID=UPI002C7965FA|nr:PKD domain-containing protein [Nocardioides sp.]HXH81238.1 PKD domain-containing protein [Nocardioides sp.]